MNSKDVTIITIVGKQNAGKTTLLGDLIPKLKEHGYTVGTLKYNIRKFDIDHDGKDTYKYYHSGADSVALSSQNKVAVIKKTARPLTLHEIIDTHLNDVSIVLVEGYREGDYPRIRITDSLEVESDNELLLIKENPETGRFSEKDINRALDFIKNILKK
ncbi:hypothetical protein SCALIN_C17_0088 [Candidatus Scalindua japonica]|uniref:Molybdopterin-guanine dinucleotide biosynthesis protein B (MobB) domain-containing protein n=1 Tax=Candidatus Scalindua japonica TaxID=1284222 RepID=A0A286TYU0_9BACT|nr:molybdopterin-guanine dinucleotide biosynthesis protein B [Candidatus Scalindua japonica]GAX61055.1 hypothetical protein SCALIN_C17_0088 [Candidatus Scalindua japonica]